MTCRNSEILESAKRTLDILGVDYRVNRRNSGHYRIMVQVSGASRAYFMSSSPGDTRSKRNCVAGLRRLVASMRKEGAL